MDAAALDRYLYDHIPLSRALSVNVEQADAAGVRVRAPLAPNLNHRSTAFGGSVAAVAVLAAWGFLRVQLDDVLPVPHLVIQRSSLEYLLPIDTDFEAWCPTPEAERWERFRRTFAQRGRARLDLQVEVRADGQLAARFHGAYVALRGDVA